MPKFSPTVVVVLGIILLSALGFFTNPKPEPAPSGPGDATRAAAEKAAAKVTPTVNQQTSFYPAI
jgi:hypothetical protein